jgi:putative Mg2+ transporter-C (MgtC) family protein
MSVDEILLRLGVATLAGIILGLDRELRGIAAGVRTHALVALSSGLITVSAMMLNAELSQQGQSGIDPLRVVQGLAQAVGFVAAGAIFFARGTVHNLTSAANIWLAAAVGIAAGAGQMVLVVCGVVMGAAVITLVRLIEKAIPGTKSDAVRSDD